MGGVKKAFKKTTKQVTGAAKKAAAVINPVAAAQAAVAGQSDVQGVAKEVWDSPIGSAVSLPLAVTQAAIQSGGGYEILKGAGDIIADPVSDAFKQDFPEFSDDVSAFLGQGFEDEEDEEDVVTFGGGSKPASAPGSQASVKRKPSGVNTGLSIGSSGGGLRI